MPQSLRFKAVSGLFLASLFSAISTSGAVLTINKSVIGETPEVLAYNLGHFYPGSNAADWWRYSRVSGARVFLTPSHFNVSGTVRPNENAVVDEASFLARRAALRADPLNTDFINWPIVEGRFNLTLTGNNRIVPEYALREIHQFGGKIKAQMTLGEGSFPISGENDWAGKWVAWRTFYSVAFYLAREFDVERFASHNEPNHPASRIEPIPWFMRLRLASDAVQAAIADVNAIYGKSLQPRFKAPVTAGTTGSAFDDYGQPALANIDLDFLGQRPIGYQSFQTYAYQSYSSALSSFTNAYHAIRSGIATSVPQGIAPLPIAVTEFNVHTGASYDAMPESSDTLSKAVRFGAQVSRYTAIGTDELYAFKFGMTRYSNNFPVQKNGMLFTDNDNAPHNYGTMSRSAEVYRLFNKGFAPGRQLHGHTLTGTGAQDLEVLVSYDSVSRFHYIFSVNETGSAIPLEIDLGQLDVPHGNAAIIEDVSQWRTGVVRSIEFVSNDRLSPGNQPGGTVWLISIPADAQRRSIDESPLFTVTPTTEVIVRDGIYANTNFAGDSLVYARNDPDDSSGRAAALLQFDLPEDWDPDDLLLGLLAIPVASITGEANNIHAHLYGIDHPAWEASSITWNTAPNLRKNAPVGNAIRHGVVEGSGDSAHILGQLTANSDWTLRRVDVTDYLIRRDNKASFLITQDPRWDVDIRTQSIPQSWADLTQGDTQSDGMRIRTSSEATDVAEAPHLILIRRSPERIGYQDWIERFFPPKILLEEPFDYPDGPLSDHGEWARGPSSPSSDNPSNHIVVANSAVLFDWTSTDPLNNVVRWIWPADDTITSAPLYAGFRLLVLEAPKAHINTRPGFLSFADSSGNQQRGFVGIQAGSTVGTYRLGVSPASQLGTNFVYAPIDLPIGQQHQVTLRFDPATENTALWINQPDTPAPAAVSANGSGSNAGIRRVNLRIYNSDGSGATTDLGRFLLDDLVVYSADPQLSQPTANPAYDGLPNLLKFILDLDPRKSASDNAPRVVVDNGKFELLYSFNTLTEGVDLVVESSHDLATWSPLNGIPQILSNGPPQILKLEIPNPPQTSQRFIRLRAQLNP